MASMAYHYAQFAIPSLAGALALIQLPTEDGQAVSAWVADYTEIQFTGKKTVTYFFTNWVKYGQTLFINERRFHFWINRSVVGKLCDPSLTRAIPERLIRDSSDNFVLKSVSNRTELSIMYKMLYKSEGLLHTAVEPNCQYRLLYQLCIN